RSRTRTPWKTPRRSSSSGTGPSSRTEADSTEAGAPATRSGAPPLKIHLHVPAHIRATVGEGGCDQLHIAREASRTFPILCILRHHLQNADGGILWIVPPSLGGRSPKFPDLFPIVADHRLAAERKVFLGTAVGKSQIDVRIAVDLLILMAVDIGQEVDRMLIALHVGHHGPRVDGLSIQARQHAESDLVHQLPSTIAFFAHRILLRLCGDCWSNVACGAWFRAWLTASCPDLPLGRFSESCRFLLKAGFPWHPRLNHPGP